MALLVVIAVALAVVINTVHAQECGGEVDTATWPSGNIISPGYPNQYPGDTLCTWIVKAPNGEKIVMEFADFDVTGSDGCAGDYLAMSDPEVDGGKESRYCGDDTPGSVASVGDSLILTFKTNWQGSCRGFNASYSVQRECLTCGATTNSMEFYFMSPGYPAEVGNDSSVCTITVEHGCEDTDNDDDGEPPGPICQLRLDFEEFQLQPPFWGDCLYDQFYAEAQNPLPILCGVNNGSHMYINVEGRSKTDLTFLLKELEYYLYHCYDLYGISNHDKEPDATEYPTPHERQRREAHKPRPQSKRGKQKKVDEHEDLHHRNDQQNQARQGSFFTSSGSASGSAAGDGDPPSSWYTEAPKRTTHKDVTVALYNYNDSTPVSFPTRRAWKIKVTQIPCDPCPKPRVPRAPEGCLQFYEGLTGEIKSFNYDGHGCYTEDRWCNFKHIAHPSDCDIRVGYTGHLNNLDYSMCVEPQSGFCGIQFQQVGVDGFSLSNISDYRDESLVPQAQIGDMECMSDYLFVPGAQNDHGKDTFERYCGTKMGNARKWATTTSYSKPFAIRMVSDSDEYSLSSDYMNRGFHLTYSQIPCKISG